MGLGGGLIVKIKPALRLLPTICLLKFIPKFICTEAVKKTINVLAIIMVNDKKEASNRFDLRRTFKPSKVIQVKVSSTLKSSSRMEKLLNNTNAKILRQNCKNDTASNYMYVASDKL